VAQRQRHLSPVASREALAANAPVAGAWAGGRASRVMVTSRAALFMAAL
jgi:hypothetical protein